jgi:hypothetical protein
MPCATPVVAAFAETRVDKGREMPQGDDGIAIAYIFAAIGVENAIGMTVLRR